MSLVFQDGVFEAGVFQAAAVVATTDLDVDVGAPTAALHRTALASSHTLDTVEWSAASPWAPFDAQPLFSMWNHLGKYLFGKFMPPEELVATVLYADSTLLSVDSIRFSATTDSSNLPGSVSGGTRSTGRVVLSNAKGEWNTRVNDEAWLMMSAGLFILIRGLWTIPRLTGVVIDMELVEDTCIIEFGSFRREAPPPGGILRL